MSEHEMAMEEAAQQAMAAQELNLEREALVRGALLQAKRLGIGDKLLRVLCSETGFPFTKLDED